MESFNKIKTLIAQTEKDADAFYNKGNKAAGTRVRKSMMELKNLAQAIRNEVSEIKGKE